MIYLKVLGIVEILNIRMGKQEYFQYTGGMILQPPIITAREILMQLLPIMSLGILIKRDGTPFVFDNTNIEYQGEIQRPKTEKDIESDRIIFTSNKNEMNTKIKKIQYQIPYTKILTDAETIYSKTMGSGTYTIYFEENYTDYAITNASIINSTRCSVTFRVNSSSNVLVTITGKKIEIRNSTDEINYNVDEPNADEIFYNNEVVKGATLRAINYWLPLYNRSFMAELQIIMDSSLNEKAGYTTKVELKGAKYNGVITEVDLDVTGGMIANVKVLCEFLISENIVTEDYNNMLTEDGEYLKTEGVDINE